MNDIICLSFCIAKVQERLEQPGVLAGRQRSPDFKLKVVSIATLILRWHRRSVMKFARFGEPHRFPFARRAVARLCGFHPSAIQRVIKILVEIGFLAEKSALARWCDGNTRSQTEGAQPFWYKPSQFQLGDDFATVLVDGAELAPSLLENHCDPDEIPNVQRKNHSATASESQLEWEEIPNQNLRIASIPSFPQTSKVDAVDDALEAALEELRRAAVPTARPDDRRALQPSPGQRLADLEARKGSFLDGVIPLSIAAMAIFE